MTNLVENPIFENKHYQIVVSTSVHSDRDIDVYQVVNKQHDVVESETSVLPKALYEAKEWSNALTDMLEDSVIDVPAPEVITIN